MSDDEAVATPEVVVVEPEITTTAASDNPPNATISDDIPTFYTPIFVMTAVFGAIFIIGPLLVKKKNEYRGIIRTCIMLSAFCMWIFWVTIYIAQMNPLIGPRVSNASLIWIAYKWGNRANSSKGDKGLDAFYDD